MELVEYHSRARRRVSWAIAIAALASSQPALAGCSAANQYAFSFATPAAATLSYASTYAYAATSTALGSQNFNVSFTTNGVTSINVGGQNMPALTTLITDGVVARNLMIGAGFAARTPSITGNTNIIVTTFTFPTPIRDFSMQVNDVDFTLNQFRDWLRVDGINASSTYVPSLTTPWGTNNTVPGPHTNASSSQAVGAVTTPVTITASESVGTGASGNNSTTGTITASFAQPVTSVNVRWGNYPLQTGETATGVQAIGIQSISYCPMPSLTTVKSSTPVVTALTDPARFNTPGSDIYYSITVANTDSSPVDANAIFVGDILPAATTFYNGDIDDTGPLTTNYEFIPGTSGLTLAAANIAYSNTAGVSYAYTPAAGYDTAMTAVRFNPQGTMAANSSFTVKFRTKIK